MKERVHCKAPVIGHDRIDEGRKGTKRLLESERGYFAAVTSRSFQFKVTGELPGICINFSEDREA